MSSRILTSIPASQIDVATVIDTDIELKLDWEDYDILSGERSLLEALDDAGVDPDRIASVHLPPGVKTRGRNIGMAATEANVGAILDFVHAQLEGLQDVFLVMHPPRQFDYVDQLSLFNELCELTGHQITIENPPDESYWYTPEDIAFFGFVGATYSDWEDLFVTVDSAHLPAGRSPADPIDRDAVEAILDRIDDVQGMDRVAIEKAFSSHLRRGVAEHRPEMADRLADDPWSPLLNVLVLTSGRVKSVHFNDPVEDGVPELDNHGVPPVLDTIREIIHAEDIHVVIEPDRETFDRPEVLERQVDAIASWYHD